MVAFSALVASTPSQAASLVGTTTTQSTFTSASRFYTHYASGYYWVTYHDGTKPVIASSADGVTWTSLGALFTFNPAVDQWATRFSGNAVIAFGVDPSGSNQRYYRKAKLNFDGTVAWSGVEQFTGAQGATGLPLNGLIAGGKPFLWFADPGSSGDERKGSQLDVPTWVDPASTPPSIAAASSGTFSAGAIFRTGGNDSEDYIVLRATTASSYSAGAHRLIAVRFDASVPAYVSSLNWYNVSLNGLPPGPYGLTEDVNTEVKPGTDALSHVRFSAAQDTNGNIHAVYVNRNDNVVHYKKTSGFNDSWSQISTDVTASSSVIDRVALASAGSNNLFLFYSKSDDGIYYKRYNGSAWGSENVVKASGGTLRGALAPVELASGSCPGLAWVEGSGSPYSVMFSVVGTCTTLSASRSASTITVETTDVKMVWDAGLDGGGGLSQFYAKNELNPTLNRSGNVDLYNLFSTQVFDTSWHFEGDSTGNLQLLEATPTRVRIRQKYDYKSTIHLKRDWTTYAYPRLAIDETLTFDVGETVRGVQGIHAKGETTCPGNTFYCAGQSSAADRLWLVTDDGPTYSDMAAFAYASPFFGRPTTGFVWEDLAEAGTPNSYLARVREASAIATAAASYENFYLFYPLVSGLTSAGTEWQPYANDYRTPDLLSITQGTDWLDSSENTTTADNFNEAEDAYLLTLNPSAGLTFAIDGGGTSHKKPFFKIRQWRSLQDPPSVTLSGATLTNDVDFKADVKPVARAHFAKNLTWYSTLENDIAVTSPNVGTGDSGGVQNGNDFPAARFGSGARFNGDGDRLVLPIAGNLDTAQGAIEFWYQPFYDYDGGDSADDYGLFGSFRVANNFFYAWHEPYPGSGPENMSGLKFRIENGTEVFETIVGAGPTSPKLWRANEWVHLRFVWKADPGRLLEIYVNGVKVSPPPTGTYGTPVSIAPVEPNFYIGDRERNNLFQNNANGVIDEFRIYSDVPSSLAQGGLRTDTGEYLADSTRNFTLAFSPVDANRRGEYFYLGSDSKFRGLNVALATKGAGSSPNLQWEYWTGTAWADLENVAFGFNDQTINLTQQSGTIYWTDPANWSLYSLSGGPDLYYVRTHLASGSYGTSPVEGIIKTDILLFQYCGDITANGQVFSFGPPVTTAAELISFEASAGTGAVELTWETTAEIENMGFYLYRGASDKGPFERITANLIPGLGSSPVGARYRYLDSGLTNGSIYYYFLEDVETGGARARHGPVFATPSAGASLPTPPASLGTSAASTSIVFGKPEETSLRVLSTDRIGVTLELLTPGFHAQPQPDGTVRLEVAGFVDENGAIPVKRAWLDAVVGRKVRVAFARAMELSEFSPLRPSGEWIPDVDATRGVVRAGGRRASPRISSGDWARVVDVVFQGERKKALVELSPIRWDGARLVLARRLLVRVVFRGREPAETSLGASLGRRVREPASHRTGNVVLRLRAKKRGLYGLSFEDARAALGRAVPETGLRLSRQGKPVAYHLGGATERFAPGTVLYFESEGASLNPYGDAAVYELALGEDGLTMPLVDGQPRGGAAPWYWQKLEREENRIYQPALLEAESPWFWDTLLSPVLKSYPFELSRLAPGSDSARLDLWLQGASDFESSPDHHVRVYVNGTLVGEELWDGKRPVKIHSEVAPGLLREGANSISVENVSDTEATSSMVLLERFEVVYPRLAEGGVEGRWTQSGVVELQGLRGRALVVDTTEETPRWVRGVEGARFRATAGRTYLTVGEEAVRRAEITRVTASSLRSERNAAEYLLIAPSELLPEAAPLLELRRSQGLSTKAVSVEEIYSEFGYGEERPEAIRDFLAYAYHHWRRPSPRYVLLLGDATYDFKNYLGTGVKNQIPPLLVKTSYWLTASDPTYAAVNGEDELPDLAIGRLPAKTREEARVLVSKILAFETRSAGLREGRAVLVVDNPDAAGDFEADAQEIATRLLAGREVETIRVSELQRDGTRAAIRSAFDRGASLMSYVGHGSILIWAGENVFNIGDVKSLSPQTEQPFLITMNCLNGYFHFPYLNSLSEELLKAEGRGVMGAFSPSGLSVDGPAHRYHQALLAELLSGRWERLGDAVLAAQVDFAAEGDFLELLRIYHLLGDPASRLR